MKPLSPDGLPIDVHPIRRDELGRLLLRCLPDGIEIEDLFKTQGTIGMGAWDGDRCIAQLHCYRLVLPHGSAEHWPIWNRPHFIEDVLKGSLGIRGPVWCHACFHVGRSIESFRGSDEPDASYFSRGIGTALCKESVSWARKHGYHAVVAPGTPDGLFEFSVWVGGLPWTTYRKLGFRDEGAEGGDYLPNWAGNMAPAEVMDALEKALVTGRPKRDFHNRMMVLRLK
jgi:GNAT superfamily N-acetyltransferase